MILTFVLTSQAFAGVDQLKYYREINPDLKPSCLYCHIDKAPKKEDGKHDLNPYGTKVHEIFEAQKVEGMTKEQIKEAYIKIFKELGRHDNFKPEEPASGE
jgi:hypothetical protein